jgi:hypothetical protein
LFRSDAMLVKSWDRLSGRGQEGAHPGSCSALNRVGDARGVTLCLLLLCWAFGYPRLTFRPRGLAGCAAAAPAGSRVAMGRQNGISPWSILASLGVRPWRVGLFASGVWWCWKLGVAQSAGDSPLWKCTTDGPSGARPTPSDRAATDDYNTPQRAPALLGRGSLPPL